MEHTTTHYDVQRKQDNAHSQALRDRAYMCSLGIVDVSSIEPTVRVEIVKTAVTHTAVTMS